MIRSFVEMMLGDFGRQILYFYEANACVFNSIIFAYGLFLLLAWNNLVRAYRYLIIEVAKKIHLDEDLNRKANNKKVRDNIETPWESAVQVSPYPFIAQIGALIPKKMNVENLQFFFDDKEIVDQAIKLLKGKNVKQMTPSSQRIALRERKRKQQQLRKEQKSQSKEEKTK